MFGLRLPAAGRMREDGEKPFWISYSDLMSALMVLFLVVMSVSLLTITQELLERQKVLEAQKAELEAQKKTLEAQKQILETQKQELERANRELAIAKTLIDALKARRKARAEAIGEVLDRLETAARADAFRGRVSISRDRLIVDFGEAARFGSGDHHLSREGALLLRGYVQELLAAVDSGAGRQWFRRVIVEGFTDTVGSYLYNLDLSMKRAQSVVCALMSGGIGETPLSVDQQRRVRELFVVGGFSFNSARASKEESRRVELRLDFHAAEDADNELAAEATQAMPSVEIGKCQLN